MGALVSSRFLSVKAASGRLIRFELLRRPEKFGEYGFDRAVLARAVEAAKQAIRSAVRLQRQVEEEERCFKHFGAWLHYGACCSPLFPSPGPDEGVVLISKSM